MPEGRILLKAISESKKLSKLKTDGARLLYTWLIPHLDINGNFSGDPLVIKGRIFTRLNRSIKEIEQYLADLEQIGLILRYSVNGDTYLTLPDFKHKQPKLRPDREAIPRIPQPSTPDELRMNSGAGQEFTGTSKVKQSKVNNEQLGVAPEFELLWSKYPRKLGKKESLRHFAASVKTDQDRADIQKALENYLADIKANKTETRYIQHGKTWFNNWRDWVEGAPPVVNAGLPESIKKIVEARK